MRGWKYVGIGLVLLLIVPVVGIGVLVLRGFSARPEPSAIEELAARTLRRLSIPKTKRDARNPVPLTPDVLALGRAHFADHCASCHGNDGRGNTTIGRNLYPRAPDMWASGTQSLSDGEIFYVIQNGVRLTGMPAWGEFSPEDDLANWHLVHFIRHLPQLTVEDLAEMRKLNPKTLDEWKEDEDERNFLEGNSTAPTPEAGHSHQH